MPLNTKGKKIKKSMEKSRYGKKKGAKHTFYSYKENSNKLKGVNKKKKIKTSMTKRYGNKKIFSYTI